MWGVFKSLLVLLSLTVNGAFVAAWLAHTRAPTAEKKPADCECQLRKQLEASDAQWQVIEPKLAAFRKACGGQCCEITRLRKELIDLLAASHPDQKAIRAKQEAILEGHRKMQELVVEHLLKAKEFLTPKQQETLFKLIRIECGCSEQGALLGRESDIECGNVLPGRPGACAKEDLSHRRSS